ncbi:MULTISPECIES: 3-hydroxyacyl-CoA dehydrogenase NAD-binding domain-containing protein [unclassified Luteimonas]|uniref:3-hydroxyacyl-CoA dehydrogenase NAD-binding domain-containing protein n=1 Tax=unclassified Luteimonas TaxID=2629088 RepID=UPI0018F0A23B|nr:MULTISPECIES: 3-hydroxyacyl-CoA dehydrogenase NAD-binding domain-containing protein [unclassified Luteimonas]MBJ6978375.1 enoyl-CoA hydratase/isomerase family protein [Luteimonas sp. MC1895]MBJ6983843.1 enoyl-CoA hydratase/isomerase family protein [Luteimonas sp. MC1750]QQO06666.1 enoyl-CoA hydratase/isomerase family protein [Luteimonas sp. MC1750]
MAVTTTLHDGIAVVTFDNPPVNGLGLDVRRGLAEAVEAANADDAIQGVVITGGGRFFSGGADIKEFDTPRAGQAPDLHDVIAVVESSAKPVCVAINGTALGGGLELALGAHYRVALRGVEVGLPEVRIGILPGGGGTQRLPRAVGLETALNMIVSGAPVAAERLAGTALFDSVVDGDPVEAAIALLRERITAGAAHPRVRDRQVEHDDAQAYLSWARMGVAAASANYPAPLRCVEAVAASLRPFDEGMAVEREGFTVLVNSPESRALRHAFFGERAASRIDDIGPDVKPRPVTRVGIVGAGTMGGGIAMNFLNAGIPVSIVETSQEALDRGLATIRRNYEGSAKKGRLTAEQVEQRMALLAPALDYAALADADLVIEAVYEDYAVKQAVFEKIDAVVKDGAILATNTSTLDVDRVAAFTRRPQDVLGLHFFSPANVMRLLEVVRGAKTAKDVMATAMAMAKAIRKTAVVSGVCDGFIGNRMVEQYSRQATFLLEEGALPQQVDRAMEAFGFAMGPFRMGDLAGNDIGWAIRKRRYLEQPDMVYAKNADLLCEMGRYGQKTGKGWYDYRPGDRTPHPSAEVEAMIVEQSKALGITRRGISDQEIVERLVYALVNEGAHILAEGIAARASDIDIVYLAGYGFPAWRGGPMFHADQVGLYNVLAAMRRHARGHRGEAWEPAPLLVELADAGRSFNDPVARPRAAAA